MDWDESRIRIPTFSVHALAGGIFAAYDDGERSITFVKLPSKLRQSPVQKWTQKGIDFPVAEIFVDLGQDLLVLVEL